MDVPTILLIYSYYIMFGEGKKKERVNTGLI